MIQDITKPELCCLNTMVSLDANPVAPGNLMQEAPFLERVMQNDFMDAWREVGQQDLLGKAVPTLPSANPGINKVRKYFKYEKPFCELPDVACPVDPCTPGSTSDETEAYLAFDIDNCVAEKWTTNGADFLNLCESPSERRAKDIRRRAYSLKRKINRKAIEALYAAISDYASDGTAGIGATTKNITLLSSKGDISPVALAKVSNEYRKALYNGSYVMFGGDTLAKFNDVNRWRISPEGRIGTSLASSALPFVYDLDFDTIFQGLEGNVLSHSVTVPVGAFMMDTWHQYTGAMERVDRAGNYMFTTLNIDGILYDYTLKYDECAHQWTETLALNFGFAHMPGACGTDGLIFHWTIGCGDIDCDAFC